MSSSSSSSSSTRPAFATYLLPARESFSRRESFTFKRRQSSVASATSTYTSTTSPGSLISTSPTSPHEYGGSWSPITTPSSSPPGTGISRGYLPARTGRPSISSLTAAVKEGLWRKDSAMTTDTDTSEEAQKQKRLGDNEVTLARSAPDTLKCSTCATDLAFSSQIVSKGFTGRHGRAYLVAPPPYTPPSTSVFQNFSATAASLGGRRKSRSGGGEDPNLINVRIGRAVNRQLVTGAHVVADISCCVCSTVVGWKYVDAKEASQKYKINKYILETRRVVRSVGWEDGVVGDEDGNGEHGAEVDEDEEDDDDDEDAIVFDSEDEDECDELFAGVWERETVRKRRGKRVGNRIR